MIDSSLDYKQIDDIIDERKKLGQYNVTKQATPINYRYTYSSATTSASTTNNEQKFIRFDDATMLLNEGDSINNPHEIKATDSEITVVRVRCNRGCFKRQPSKWDMHDIAIPGDGSHLGESPSMVNLATLVQQTDEYLVPLSSWDPYYTKIEDITNCDVKSEKHQSDEDVSSIVASQISDENTNSVGSAASSNSRRSLAGRISKFLRKHYKKSKTLPAPTNPNEKQ